MAESPCLLGTPRLLGTFGRRDVVRLGTGGLMAASLFAGGRARADQPKRIALGHPDRTANFYQGFMNAALDEAKKYNYEVLQSFSGMDPAKQMSELNAWLAAGVDAMVVLALDAHAMGSIVQRCHDRGIIFVGYAVLIDGEDGYIKWADKDAGTMMGERVARHIKERLGGKADVGYLTYITMQVVIDRMGAARAAILKELPDTKFYEATAVNAPDALKATQSMLQAHPDLKVLVCCSDDAALGARSAYQNSGLSPDNVFISGFDGAKENLELIRQKDKFLQASAALDIADIGRKVIDIPHGIWTKAPESQTHVIEPYLLITDETDPAIIDRLLKVYG